MPSPIRARSAPDLAALVFVLVAALTTAVPAAAAGFALAGRVTDPRGDPVAGATLAARNLASGATHRARSAGDGSYRLADLAAGTYEVVAEAPYFVTSTRAAQVGDGGDRRLDFALAIRGVARSVTVIEHPREELERVPGSTAEVSREEIERTRASNVQDVLAFQPGIVARSRFGADEAQFSIRGSGLRNNFHMRGLNLLINGRPYQDADGFGDFESLEMMATDRIEVWKGANALRFGGNSSGGAINFVTRTGDDASPLQARLEGGSYGLVKGQLSSGARRGSLAYYSSLSALEMDGYRDHAGQSRRRLFSNLSWQPSAATDLRWDLIYADVEETLPGSLTRAEVEADPRQANPENVGGDWGRRFHFVHAAFALDHRLDEKQVIAASLFGHFRDMVHPIFQVIDQEASAVGVDLAYRYEGSGAHPIRFLAGFSPLRGDSDDRRFANQAGRSGALLASFRTPVRNHGLYLEGQLDARPALTLVAGLRADWSRREYRDRFLADGDDSDRRTFRALSPRVGLVWHGPGELQLFGNLSRAHEPPLILELASFGAPGFLPLEAQSSWQMEVGSRGAAGDRLDWDVALFDVEIDDEIINLNLTPFPGAPFTIPSYVNAPRTRHLGLEAGAGLALGRSLVKAGDGLRARAAYTFSDFHFVDHPVYGDNDLAGAPPHLLQLELRYTHPAGFWIAPAVDASLAAYHVDSASTASNGAWGVLGLRCGYDRGRVALYLEGVNLTDRVYAGSVQVDSADGRYFEPASGRSVTLSGSWKW